MQFQQTISLCRYFTLSLCAVQFVLFAFYQFKNPVTDAVHARIRKAEIHALVVPDSGTDSELLKCLMEVLKPEQRFLRINTVDHAVLAAVKSYVTLLGNRYGLLEKGFKVALVNRII